jgi:PAS domain S-box-containing protein
MPEAKILVVEDDGLTAMELQRKLKTWGYDVPSFAFSRKEAVKKAKEIKPDLILMDVMLKGQGDGIDAATEIKNIQDIPIIYLTAYGDSKTRKRAEITSPTAYIIKPFEENELQDKIETALSEHKLEKKLFQIGKTLDDKLSDSGVIVINLSGVIIYINKFAGDFTDFEEGMTVNKELVSLFPLDGIKKGEGYSTDFIASGTTPITSKSIIKDHSSDKVHIEYTISFIEGETPGSVGASIVFQDVSQQVEDEKSLKEREQKFHNIYSESLATEVFDAEGNLLEANPASLELFGVSDFQLLQQFNLFDSFKLDDKELEKLKKGLKVHFDCKLDWDKLNELKFQKTTETDSIYLNIHVSPLKLDETHEGYLVQFQDITDHRQLEEYLKDTGEKYVKMLETLDQGLMVYNNDLKCIYSNHRVKEIVDCDTDAVIGRALSDAIKSLWDSELEEMCGKTLETGNSYRSIKISKDEKPFYIEINTYKFFEGLMVTLDDVTDLKKREDDLKRNEELYRSVVDEESEIVCRFNKDMELTFANEAYYNFFGLKSEFNTVFALSEEDRDQMKVHFQSLGDEDSIRVFEGPIKMASGELRWWQWVTRALYNSSGQIEEYQSVGRDLTEYHKKMEKLQENLNKSRSSLESVNTELDEVKISLKSQIKDKNEKIKSLERLNEQLGTDFTETVGELEKTIKNQEVELKNLQNREEALEKNRQLLEEEIKGLTADYEKSSQALDDERVVRKKLEDELKEKSSNLEKQANKSAQSLSKIADLEKEIEDFNHSQKSWEQEKVELGIELSSMVKQLENTTRDLSLERSKRLVTEKALKKVKKDLAEKTEEIRKKTEDLETKNEGLTRELALKTTDLQEKSQEITRLGNDFAQQLEDLQNAEQLARKSLEKRERVLKNVYTGVKMNMQMISSLNRLHSEYVIDEMVNKLKDGRSYLRSFGLVHEKLYQSEDLEHINLQPYLDSILQDIVRSQGAKDVDITIKTHDAYLNMDMAVLSGLVISELVINSLKHGFPNKEPGEIRVEVVSEDEELVINVADNGVGLPRHVSIETPDSFGLQLVKTFVDQSEGSVEVKDGDGANFVIKIPKVSSNSGT